MLTVKSIDFPKRNKAYLKILKFYQKAIARAGGTTLSNCSGSDSNSVMQLIYHSVTPEQKC
jgi:hypothetical protein